jgi:hypothetical protein
MRKLLTSIILALLAAAATTTSAATMTNVLQNIDIQLTIYQQGATNSEGTKVADSIIFFTSKKLIEAVGAITGNNFGSDAKLVQATVFSNVIIDTGPGVFSNYLSTNLALPATNGSLYINGSITSLGTNIGTITTNQLTESDGIQITIHSDIVAAAFNTNEYVTINTNEGFVTTLTPSTNGLGMVTNIAVLTQLQVRPPPTKSFLTNISSSIDILYGGTANSLYPVTSYLSFGTNSPEIVVETGSDLNTGAPLTVSNLVSQTGFSIQNMQINYFTLSGSNNLTLALLGFVKQALKVDVLSANRTNRAVEDIFGASSSWNVIGSGYSAGTYTTNPTPVAISMGDSIGYVTNASPIVVEGTVNFSFFKNLAR